MARSQPLVVSTMDGVEVTVSVEIHDTSESVRVTSVLKKQQHVKLRD